MQLEAKELGEFPLQCPNCGNVAPMDAWDVMGCDEDKLWCNACMREVVPIEVIK